MAKAEAEAEGVSKAEAGLAPKERLPMCLHRATTPLTLAMVNLATH